MNVHFRPGSYVAFLPCRMQFKQKIMKQIVSLSIVLIAFDTAEPGLRYDGNEGAILSLI